MARYRYKAKRYILGFVYEQSEDFSLKGEVIMAIVIGLIFGVIVGVVIKTIAIHSSSVGTIYIYNGDPEENPYMFLALSGGIDKFFKKRYVVLKIELKDIPPQH